MKLLLLSFTNVLIPDVAADTSWMFLFHVLLVVLFVVLQRVSDFTTCFNVEPPQVQSSRVSVCGLS